MFIQIWAKINKATAFILKGHAESDVELMVLTDNLRSWSSGLPINDVTITARHSRLAKQDFCFPAFPASYVAGEQFGRLSHFAWKEMLGTKLNIYSLKDSWFLIEEKFAEKPTEPSDKPGNDVAGRQGVRGSVW